MKNKVYIYDTTLRDGAQGVKISYSLEDKLVITKKLDELGVDYIEGGWPNKSNVKTIEYFKRVKELDLKNSKIAAFGSTRSPLNKVEDDPTLSSLLEAETPVLTIFGKTWDLHVTKVLKTSLEENLVMIEDSVSYLKKHNKEVIFIAEHFFDGYKYNPDYTLKCLLAAEKASADSIVLADTNGGTTVDEIHDITKEIYKTIKIPLGIHSHNDMELAVANSLAAVKNGFTQIQGTMNGFGERCGNANLTTIIPILSLKMNFQTIPDASLCKLTENARFIYDIANIPPNENQPFIGQNAFSHKAGVHANAIIKESTSYEFINPMKVGNSRNILVSEQAGVSSLVYKAKELGITLEKDDTKTRDLLFKLKELENEGYEFESADASLKLFLMKQLFPYKQYFDLVDFRVIVETKHLEIFSDATIKIKVKGVLEHTAAEGNGPVNALDNALKKALCKFYPSIGENHLIDYKVRVIEGTSGTSAKVKVFIETKDLKEVWTTVGVSENIIKASWIALVDSVEYKLLRDEQELKDIASSK
ncbi:2-isopropylmalate synthase [Desulfonispora thiosulfatigenes DSM 11270]|uniref:Citramalate synthase n=1 Tax=Desulfonispora thiosulfatigenes DSM 11270 TaxID=656914 RepID=A0A1W1VGW0_DESTI|nr:citramalate synthase [Desulfonispora thiosulfatigenes]SMB92460.1 2-isopropylmalate synthase [Desulfonispora thiosulfatigenes DSM 11270]